jgi:hypothetical protein
MGIGTIGISPPVVSVTPEGAGARLKTIKAGGYNSLGILAAGKYVLSDCPTGKVQSKFGHVFSSVGRGVTEFTVNTQQEVFLELTDLNWTFVPDRNSTNVTQGSNAYDVTYSDDRQTVVLQNGGSSFLLSVDGGETYVNKSHSNVTGNSTYARFGAVVAPNGDVYYVDHYDTPNSGSSGVRVRKSTDGGTTWTLAFTSPASFSSGMTGSNYSRGINMTFVGNRFFLLTVDPAQNNHIAIHTGQNDVIEASMEHQTNHGFNSSSSNGYLAMIKGFGNSVFVSVYKGSSYNFQFGSFSGIDATYTTGTGVSLTSSGTNRWHSQYPMLAWRVIGPSVWGADNGQSDSYPRVRHFQSNEVGSYTEQTFGDMWQYAVVDWGSYGSNQYSNGYFANGFASATFCVGFHETPRTPYYQAGNMGDRFKVYYEVTKNGTTGTNTAASDPNGKFQAIEATHGLTNVDDTFNQKFNLMADGTFGMGAFWRTKKTPVSLYEAV